MKQFNNLELTKKSKNIPNNFLGKIFYRKNKRNWMKKRNNHWELFNYLK